MIRNENIRKIIVEWLVNQNEKAGTKGFVVGISGGIDSAVVSTLCAQTSLPVYAIQLPIESNLEHSKRAEIHCQWLKNEGANVHIFNVDLTQAFRVLENLLVTEDDSELVAANIKSRLRMVGLYAFANSKKCLVVGTGNKVEDFGIGFCTKGGDSQVDISPIGDLMKSEVRDLAKHLGINEEIINAAPSDGLWSDSRCDEDQIGATYDELEWAMNYLADSQSDEKLTERKSEVLSIYLRRHNANRHKMQMPPICRLN